MIIALANKRLLVTQEEKDYISTLVNSYGEDEFIDLFQTDKLGMITSISPPAGKPISMIILFFMMNLMHNQRVRAIDATAREKIEALKIESKEEIDSLKERISVLEFLLEEMKNDKI